MNQFLHDLDSGTIVVSRHGFTTARNPSKCKRANPSLVVLVQSSIGALSPGLEDMGMGSLFVRF